jgi:cobalt transporter subunit CbtB
MAIDFSNNNHAVEHVHGASARPMVGDLLADVWPPLTALALGALVIFAVGFSGLDVAHNAAHDTRHAMVFPCH